MGLDGPRHERGRARGDAAAARSCPSHLRELVDDALDGARQPRSARTDWALVERLVLLRTIDSLWVEHLTELDDMRRGIGLRGYAQQDPLNEFKKEAFGLYEELRALIRHQVATTIFRVTVTRGPAPDSAEEQLGADLAAGAEALRAANAGGPGSRHGVGGTTSGGGAGGGPACGRFRRHPRPAQGARHARHGVVR